MEKRYRALRLMSSLYKLAGGIVGAITALLAVATCVLSFASGGLLQNLSREYGGSYGLGGLLGGATAGVIASLLIILYGGVIATSLYGTGEIFSLFVDLEANTRETAALLKKEPPAASL